MPAHACADFKLVCGIKMRRLGWVFRPFSEPGYRAHGGYSSGAWRENDTFGISRIVRCRTRTYQPEHTRGSSGPVYAADGKLRGAGQGGGVGI